MNTKLWKMHNIFATDVVDEDEKGILEANTPELAQQIIKEHNAMVGMYKSVQIMREALKDVD